MEFFVLSMLRKVHKSIVNVLNHAGVMAAFLSH